MDLFITGTDTGIGKTLVAAAFIQGFAEQGLKTVGMKPIASGQDGDAEKLMEESNVSVPKAFVNPYAFQEPISPHLAAHYANVHIDIGEVSCCYRQLKRLADVVVIEGAGGILCPLSATQTMLDLAVALGLPVVFVVGLRLGCINHALMTETMLLSAGLTVKGWVANLVDPAMRFVEDNLHTLRQRLQSSCLGVIPHGASTVEVKTLLFPG